LKLKLKQISENWNSTEMQKYPSCCKFIAASSWFTDRLIAVIARFYLWQRRKSRSRERFCLIFYLFAQHSKIVDGLDWNFHCRHIFGQLRDLLIDRTPKAKGRTLESQKVFLPSIHDHAILCRSVEFGNRYMGKVCRMSITPQLMYYILTVDSGPKFAR